MADWSSRNIMLTTKGAAAISKVQSGSGKLTITKVVASEQYVSESTLREVTSLSVENLPLTVIDRHEVSDGGSVIQVQLNNLNLSNPFVFNEIGVFATHSDSPSEEFLYIIAQVNANTGDRIPLYSTTPITATYDIYLYNVGADNVEVIISSSGLVTYEALNEACKMVKRSTSYTEGDTRYSYSVPIPYYLRCKVKGTTSSSSLVVPSDIKEGDTITDGTVVWEVIRLASYHELQTATTTLTGEVTSTNMALAESTGYGIVSGCTPSISGLTVTVASGVVHLSNGTRKELSASTVTLDAANASNPRIDIVYIDSTGTVAKVTGTSAASPTVPSVPSGGISVAQVSVAAKATVGTLKEYRMMLQTFDKYLALSGGTMTGNLTVPTITGHLVGNADTATTAEKDSKGNVIPSTYATKAEVNTQISELVDSAPDALNTLKKLAAALGNDNNFSTTITNALAEKLPKTGGTMTGALTVPALHGTADNATHAGTADNATNASHANNADNATHSNAANHTDNSISFKNTNGNNVSFNGNAEIDLTGGVYYAKESSHTINADNANSLGGSTLAQVLAHVSATNTGGIVAQSLKANGYVKFAGGLILQWGYYDSQPADYAERTIVFPLGFTAACFSVQITGVSIYGNTTAMLGLSVSSVTKTSFVAHPQSSGITSGYYYIAIGV